LRETGQYHFAVACGYYKTHSRDNPGRINSVADNIGALRDEVGTFRDEIGIIRDEVGSLRTDFGGLRNEFQLFRGEMEIRLDRIESMTNQTRAELLTLRADFRESHA
jgi:HAMP domain-containing protein